MLKQVKRFCEQYGLLSKSNAVVAACSGGPDSMAMLDILLQLRSDIGFKLAVAHYEHGIRGQESLDDAAFVKEYCQERGLDFYMESGDAPAWAKDHGESLETAARNLRYAFLRRVADKMGGALIATAHHRDDQAETVLMHILRGSGLTGLSGIRPIRDNLIRPMLCCSKEQLLDYCYQNRIPARMDGTNEIPNCTRNRVRLNLMPSLASSYNQAITEGLCHLAEIAAVDSDFIQSSADRVYDELVTEKNGRFSIKRDDFLRQHLAVQRRLLQRLIRQAADVDTSGAAPMVITATNSSNMGYVHVRLLKDFMEAGRTGSRVSLPGDVQAYMEYGVMTIYKKTAEAIRLFSVSPVKMEIPGTTELADAVITAKLFDGSIPSDTKFSRGHAVLDFDKCQGPLTVRFRQEGDRVSLRGGSKKLKDFFIDKKMPREERLKTPLVCDEQGILWIAGQQQTVLAATDENTNHFLVLELERGL